MASADVEPKASFRTCGNRPDGAAKVGPRKLDRRGHSASVPTIPSRFEVTLLKGDLEFKGFGSKSLRFGGGAQKEDVPGPGEYKQAKSGIQEFLDREHWGKRGTGGFASRSIRFGARSMPQMPPPGLGCPGPGAYRAEDAVKNIKNARDYNHAKTSAVFSAQLGKSVPSMSSVPGPGHYGAPTRPPKSTGCPATSSFISTSMRGVAGADPHAGEGPGPGEHYVDHEGAKREPPAEPTLQGASFKGAVERRTVRVHADLPAASMKAREVLGDFGDEVGRIPKGTMGLMRDLPGPGHYRQDRDSMWKGHLVGVNGSSSFQKGPGRTEFAPEELGLLPGPGRYEPQKGYVVPKLATDAVSAFSSVTVRNKLQVPEAPGPAYYTPAELPKKNFRLNVNKQWGP